MGFGGCGSFGPEWLCSSFGKVPPKHQGMEDLEKSPENLLRLFLTFLVIFQGGPGSVRFGYGLEMERFKRFRFSVPAVPLRRGFFCIIGHFLRGSSSQG